MNSCGQLNLFEPAMLKSDFLVADSPREAFYCLRLEYYSYDQSYRVKKESGIKTTITLDRRVWRFGNFDDAAKYYERIIKDKTNPARKSPRKYSRILDMLME